MIPGDSTGFCAIDGVIEAVNSGFTGDDYLNSQNEAGSRITWQLIAGEPGQYEVEIRYANGGNRARNADLLVNGQLATSWTFPATGNWTTWERVTASVTLPEGVSEVRLVATAADGLANVDYIRLAGAGVIAGNCGVNPNPNPVPNDAFALGEVLYGQQCSGCHGADGEGGAVNRPMVECNVCDDMGALANYIEVAMPPANPGACDDNCAMNVATYIMQKFNRPGSADGTAITDVRVWRLTIEEYKNTLTRLLNLPAGFTWLEGPADRDSEDYFHTNSDFLQVDVTTARYFSEQSESIAWGLSDAQFDALIGCDVNSNGCIAEFTQDFASRAFRRPMSQADTALYQSMAEGTQGLERYRRIVYSILNSPYFLYRTEMGSEGNLTAQEVRLTDHEIASMLSYSLLGMPPSDELVAAADAGRLGSPDAIRSFTRELLAQPQATERLHRFIRGWLLLDEDNWKEVSRDPEACPRFDDMKGAIANEFQMFLNSNATTASSFANLLTAYFPEPAGELRDFYGAGADPAGLGPLRQGVLNSGMFSANHARFLRPSPVRRGVFIRERLLCQDFEVPDDVPPLMETNLGSEIVTNRDLYEQHVADPACSTCHQFFDPLGFTMENLDACGRFRSVDNGELVDTSGLMLGTDFDTSLSDADVLSSLLANQKQVRECFVEHAFQFYRGLSKSDQPAELIDSIAEGMAEDDSYSGILIQLLANPNVLTRKR